LRALGTTCLYLLALVGVGTAQIAWSRPSPLVLASWAVALGVALGLGERFAAYFETVEDKRRDKLTVFMGTLQLSVLVLGLVLAAGRPTPGLLEFLTGVLSGYMLLVLLLARLGVQPRGVVAQALALVTLTALRGGPLASVAVGAALALVGIYVGLDHHSRLLANHRLDEARHATRALARAAALVLPVALAVGVGVQKVAPRGAIMVTTEAPADEGYVPLEQKEERELDLQALRSLVVTGLMGAIGVYFLGRWLVRSKRGEEHKIEAPEALRGAVERIRARPRHRSALPEYPGRRGRVVRAYLNLLRGAERAGFPRRLHETPDEFAAALGEPREALEATTERFVRARYGHFDVTDEDVRAAESGVDGVLGHLAREPPRRRREVVRDADQEAGASPVGPGEKT